MSKTIDLQGAVYSDVPGIQLPVHGGGTAYFPDTTDANATAGDIASGKTAYVNGTKIVGTASGGGGAVVVTDTTDVHGGTIREITAVDISSDTVSAASMLSGVTADDHHGTAVTGSIATKTSADLTASGDTVTVPSGYYASAATKAVASGSATTPATTVTANPTISVNSSGLITASVSTSKSVTPTVSAGYVSSGTAGTVSVSGSNTSQLTAQAAQTLYPSTSDQTINSGRYLTGNQTIKGVAVSNTLTAANIKSGVVVTIGDSADADRIMSVTGTYSGGGSSVSYDTKTTTASNYPVSLSFSSMKGEPKAFVCRLNAQVSSSGNTTYYYIVDVSAFGTTTHGNCFRIGGTRRVDNITSGYSYTYSNGTLTITSSAASRSASPGAFYSGSYELLYCY